MEIEETIIYAVNTIRTTLNGTTSNRKDLNFRLEVEEAVRILAENPEIATKEILRQGRITEISALF